MKRIITLILFAQICHAFKLIANSNVISLNEKEHDIDLLAKQDCESSGIKAFAKPKSKCPELFPDEDDDDDDDDEDDNDGCANGRCATTSPKTSSTKIVQTELPVTKKIIEPKETDQPNCIGAYKQTGEDGVFELKPPDRAPYKAQCKRDLFEKYPAWTVILNRNGGPLSFERSFEEYVNGFGELDNEHWLGLKLISSLTSLKRHELLIRIRGDNCQNETQYNNFVIGDADEDYILKTLGKTTVNNGDLEIDDLLGKRFSTKDHNLSKTNCAQRLKIGWWFAEDENQNCGQFIATSKYENDGSGELFFSHFGCKVTNVLMAIREENESSRKNIITKETGEDENEGETESNEKEYGEPEKEREKMQEAEIQDGEKQTEETIEVADEGSKGNEGETESNKKEYGEPEKEREKMQEVDNQAEDSEEKENEATEKETEEVQNGENQTKEIPDVEDEGSAEELNHSKDSGEGNNFGNNAFSANQKQNIVSSSGSVNIQTVNVNVG